MAVQRIFCPMDFSDTSDAALRVAIDLTRTHHAELVIANAWEMVPLAYSGIVIPGELIQSIADNAEAGLARALTVARAAGISNVSTVLLRGSPWEAIVEQAQQQRADLIVMGTHGRTGLGRTFLGSVAEMVIRHAACSVLALPLDQEPTAFRHVLCATDFSPSAQAARDLALELCPATADFTFAHVVDAPSAEVVRHVTTSSRAALDRWVEEVKPRSAHAELLYGSPGRELRALLDRRAFDLVVMGSHGRIGLRRIILGSVAETTLRHAHRAVLVSRGESA